MKSYNELSVEHAELVKNVNDLKKSIEEDSEYKRCSEDQKFVISRQLTGMLIYLRFLETRMRMLEKNV